MEKIKTEILTHENQIYIIELAEEYSNYYIYTLEGNKNSFFLKKQLKEITYDLSEAIQYFEQLVALKISQNYNPVKDGDSIDIPAYDPQHIYGLHEL